MIGEFNRAFEFGGVGEGRAGGELEALVVEHGVDLDAGVGV